MIIYSTENGPDKGINIDIRSDFETSVSLGTEFVLTSSCISDLENSTDIAQVLPSNIGSPQKDSPFASSLPHFKDQEDC